MYEYDFTNNLWVNQFEIITIVNVMSLSFVGQQNWKLLLSNVITLPVGETIYYNLLYI